MKYLLFLVLTFWISAAKAQQVKSIHFHLYTDSLKKGTHNYINVDAKMSDGSWKPLTEHELGFTASYGTFERNSLVLPQKPSVTSVTITAALKNNKQLCEKITIWIKQKPDPPLRTDKPRRRMMSNTPVY